MKKNFFKKLSFVMALAMIISVIAPAAGAFAATSPALSATKKYLHLSGQPGSNEYDFNIKNKVAGSKYAWSSANEDVATVDESNGLTTATGVGSTKITVVITLKDGKEKKLSATVVVRDNIDTVKISNAPDKAIAVNQEYDFNRSFVTLAGSTKKTSSVTRWTVDSDKATINDSGVFKATEAGTYKVTAYSFQSSAKYTEWLASKAADLVLATDEVTVKVAPSIVSVNQVSTTKFAVTFDSDMSKSDLSTTTAKLFQVINGKDVATGTEKIKAIALDSTGKIATIEMFTNFAEKADYKFTYGDLVGTFTSASTDLSEVASIEFADFTHDPTSTTATAMLSKVIAKNKNGVVILTGDTSSAFAGCLSFTYDGVVGKGFVDNSSASVFIYEEGYAAPVTATFTYYSYNTTTKVYDTITLKDSAIVTGKKTDTNLNTATIQYAVATAEPAADSSAWTDAKALAAYDNGYKVFTRTKNNNQTADDPYTVDRASRFVYVSNDTDKLSIIGNYLLPVKAGVVTVLVKDTLNDNKVVGTFDITIQPTRAFASAVFDNAYISVSNNGTYGALGADILATITVKDTMGAAALASAAQKSVTGPAGKTAPTVIFDPGTGDNTGKVFVKVNASAADAGVYGFTVTVTACGQTKDLPFTVVVVDGKTNLQAVTWKLDLSATSFDLKEVNAAKTVTIHINGYNSNGVVVNRLPATAYDVTITKDGAPINVASYTDEEFYVVTTGAALTPVATAPATFVVTAKSVGTNDSQKPVGYTFGIVAFALTDSTTKNVKVDSPIVTNNTVLEVVKSALTLVLNGADVSDDNITGVKYMVANKTGDQTDATYIVTTGSSIFVKEVTYTVHNDNGTNTVYTFTVNANITTK